MLKLVLIFLIGIAYAAQTRVKIGSKSWAYRIELNQGQNIRTEFSDDQGVAIGSYVYQFGNQTKMVSCVMIFNILLIAPLFGSCNIESIQITKSQTFHST